MVVHGDAVVLQEFAVLQVLFVACGLLGAAEPSTPDEWLIINANVVTLDGREPVIDAVWVRGDRIMGVGSREWCEFGAGRSVHKIDVHGATVTRGFFDAHAHLMSGGCEKLLLDLTGCASEAEMVKRTAAYARLLPGDAWVRGRGFDQSLWLGQKWPTRASIDEACGERPALLRRVDGHAALANTKALALAGIDASTPDPKDGVIERDAAGEPTGILKEGAVDLVGRLVPAITRAEKKRGALYALAECAKLGITSVTDHGGDPTIYRELLDEGRLTARFDVWLDLGMDIHEAEAIRTAMRPARDWIRVETLKGFVDGTFGSRTAAMLAPFHDDPTTSGVLMLEQDQLVKLAREADSMGFQVALHAIGDRAVRLALDAFQAVSETHKGPALRHRIEHVQVLAPGDAERFARLGVTASVQPCHLLSDMRFAGDRLGPERIALAYPYATLHRAGALLAFGTDYPVEPLDPRRNLFAALVRSDEHIENATPLTPSERLDPDTTLAAMTVGGATACSREKELGPLVPGSLADLVVIDMPWPPRDARALLTAPIRMTIVGGRIVHE